jgi:hypothetical protein
MTGLLTGVRKAPGQVLGRLQGGERCRRSSNRTSEIVNNWFIRLAWKSFGSLIFALESRPLPGAPAMLSTSAPMLNRRWRQFHT